MSVDFVRVFAALKPVLASHASRLSVKSDTPDEYSLVTKSPSPLPQHKGQAMWFGAVKVGKAYVSYHLMPLYMNPILANTISPELRKRMQGKSCFNFKVVPTSDVLAELTRLTAALMRLRFRLSGRGDEGALAFVDGVPHLSAQQDEALLSRCLRRPSARAAH